MLNRLKTLARAAVLPKTYEIAASGIRASSRLAPPEYRLCIARTRRVRIPVRRRSRPQTRFLRAIAPGETRCCGHSCPMPLGFEARSHACQRRFGRQRQSGGPVPPHPKGECRRKKEERGVAPVQPAVFILHSAFYILHFRSWG